MRREAREPDDGVTDDADVGGRDGRELAPELVEGVAVEPAGARLEPLGVDEVGAPTAETCTVQRGVLADEDACRARVVEVDVGEQQVADVAGARAARAEGCAKRGNARRGAAVEQREAVVRLDEVCADPAGVAEVDEVEGRRRHAGTLSRVSRTPADGPTLYRRMAER